MTTTTIRLPEELKNRIDKLASASGRSTHGFMVEALERAADQLERKQAFDAEVEARWQAMLQTGAYHTLEDVKAYGMALARGEEPARPMPRTMSAEKLERLRAFAARSGDA